jgi:hypothetical protein
MVPLLAIVTKLLTATTRKMSKLFAREALDMSEITTFTSTLSSICNRNRLRSDSIMRHGSLSSKTLFLSEKFTNTCI